MGITLDAEKLIERVDAVERHGAVTNLEVELRQAMRNLLGRLEELETDASRRLVLLEKLWNRVGVELQPDAPVGWHWSACMGLEDVRDELHAAGWVDADGVGVGKEE